jgi:putative intracellular protease/amidase
MTISKRMRTVLIIVGGVIVIVGALVIAAPSLIQAMGVHKEYTGPRYELPGGKALIIATNHDELGDDGTKTGVFGSELTAPYYEFLDNGMEVDIASIEGGEIPFDPLSFNYFITSDYDKRMEEDPVLLAKVENSIPISDLDFAEYDVIFLAGGWGAAYDLGFSQELGDKMTEGYVAGSVVGGVCHGPLGLLNAEDENGDPLVKGRTIVAVTDKQVDELGINITPLHPETELRKAGADFESSTGFRDFFASHTVVDGRIVSGQNQNDGPEVAHLMMKVAGGTQL